MKKSIFCVLSVAAIMGAVLTSTAASAAVTVTARTSSLPPGDPATTITFAVGTGLLTMTAPGAATLGTGSGQPGTIISGLLGTNVVTDSRALLAASWTVSVSSSDFTTGAATPAETIPVADVTYDPGTVSTTGNITATPHPITLSHAAQTVVNGTAGVGNNTATWDPALEVSVPAAAVGGAYSGTITDSVS